MASGSDDEDNEPQTPTDYIGCPDCDPQTLIDYVVCPDCDCPTFFCSDCGKEIKFRTKSMEIIVLLLWKVFRLRQKASLAEAMSSTLLGTTTSTQVQQQSNLLDQAREPPVDTQVGHPQTQPRLPLALEASNSTHHPPALPQPEATSAQEELATAQYRYARPDWQPERIFTGQDGSYSQVRAADPINDSNTQTGDESPSSSHEQDDMSSALSANEDDGNGRNWSPSSSQLGTDGSEPGSRRLSRKDLKAIEKVKVCEHLTWWSLEDGW
ncbi:hypothetical protein LA080_001976 [Diaporthe eres]|nr:hypothetical protein LA080_001976 [Diaporthe eres]